MIGIQVTIEYIFAVPGMGSAVLNAVVNRDFPVIQGFTLVIAAFFLFANIIADLFYAPARSAHPVLRWRWPDRRRRSSRLRIPRRAARWPRGSSRATAPPRSGLVILLADLPRRRVWRRWIAPYDPVQIKLSPS